MSFQSIWDHGASGDLDYTLLCIKNTTSQSSMELARHQWICRDVIYTLDVQPDDARTFLFG